MLLVTNTSSKLTATTTTMSKFILSLENIELEFDLLETSIARRWAKEIEANYPLFETERFKGWDNKNVNFYNQEINKQLQTLGKDPYTIKSQEDLNNLHKIFECLRGPVEEESDYYKNSDQVIKSSINNLNILIHECEHVLRYGTRNPELVCTYQNRPRYKLQEQDYDLFTAKWKFGTVYINYCEVGKPLIDVYKDQDTIVGTDNVRPLEYYSADFVIKFGPSISDEEYAKSTENFQNWLSKQTYSFQHLSLGLIPVAVLNTSYSPEELIGIIANNQRIKSTCLR